MLTKPLKVARSLLHTVMGMVFPDKCRLCRRFTVNEPCYIKALDFGVRLVPSTPVFQSPAHNICRYCAAKFKVVPNNICPRCGCEPEDGVCVNCRLHPPRYVDRYMSLSFYNRDIGPVIKRFKYGGDLYINCFLSQCLLAGLALNAKNDMHYNIIVPVPLHPKKQKARKFNQNERLLHYWRGLSYNNIACLQKSVLDYKLLIRRKHTKPQAGLNIDDRALNVADAFEIKDNRDLSGLSILIADDIVTTGATAENCAKALKACGAARVDVICIARTMPHLNPNHLMEI